jgi:hypothetical protein
VSAVSMVLGLPRARQGRMSRAAGPKKVLDAVPAVATIATASSGQRMKTYSKPWKTAKAGSAMATARHPWMPVLCRTAQGKVTQKSSR